MDGELTTASLVVGGTGMLAGATRWLAHRSAVTYLVARGASRFSADGAKLSPIDCDWNSASFASRLQALPSAPPIGSALLWLHDPQPVLTWLLPLLQGARVVLVLGSMDGRPELPSAAATCATVRLGSMPTSGGRRWLTDEEISNGAIDALQDGRSRVVGDLTTVDG